MGVELERSQQEIIKAASEFAKGEFQKELALNLDQESEFPKKIWEKAAELGFVGIHFDEVYSGGGLGCLEGVLMAEAFCRQDSSMGAALTLAGFGAECLLRFGSEELKRKYLPGVAEGRMLCGGAFVGGTHDHGLKTPSVSAVKQSEDWLVNGKTINVINGKTADILVVSCNSESGTDTPINPILLLIEKPENGFEVHGTAETLGLRMTSIADIEFNNVCVPLDHVIGGIGKTQRMLKVFWNECRILLAGMAVGTAQGAFDRARAYVKQRVQFGKKLAQFQVTRHKLARMAVKIEAARRLTYHAASQGKAKLKNNTPSLGSMAKSCAAHTAVEVSYEAIQLMGGYGYMKEYDVERYYRDAKTIEIICGSPYRLLDYIGESVVGRVR